MSSCSGRCCWCWWRMSAPRSSTTCSTTTTCCAGCCRSAARATDAFPPRRSTMTRLALLLCALALPGLASAADYTVQSAGSTLAFHGNFQGSGFDGHFEKFDAAIAYDAAHLEASKFDVTVDLASARTGDND